MTTSERIRFKFTSDYPLKYGANAAAEFDNPDWPRFVRITDVTQNGNLREDTFRSLPPEVARGYGLEEGDILLARSGATVGKTFIYELSWGKACYAGYLIRSRTSDSHWSKFIYWYFQSTEYWAEIQSNLIQATIQNFSAEKYANIGIPSFPLETQKRIATFLDEKTAQIDGLIEKKRALLDRLAEKRQAIITQAVTKGLDPAAAMKDSGIDWLGEIPEHWEVKRLKFVADICPGYAFSSDDFIDEGCPIIRISDVLANGTVDTSQARRLPNHFLKEYREYIIRHGDIVMAMTGATVGKSAKYLLTDSALLNQRICRIRPNKETVHDEYIWSCAQSAAYIEFITLFAYGGAQPNISDKLIGELRIAQPPLETQKRIATFLDEETAKIDGLNERVLESIEKLTEYRSALITAAVTGQIEGLR